MIAAGLAASDTTDGRALTEEKFWTVKLSAMEYAETFDISLDTAYEQLQDGADKLLTKLIVRPDRDRKGDEVGHRGCCGPNTRRGRGLSAITWHPDVRPYLFCLRQEFTTYKLKHAAALRSVYSWRLFENLKSWNGAGKWGAHSRRFRTRNGRAAELQDKFQRTAPPRHRPGRQRIVRKERPDRRLGVDQKRPQGRRVALQVSPE